MQIYGYPERRTHELHVHSDRIALGETGTRVRREAWVTTVPRGRGRRSPSTGLPNSSLSRAAACGWLMTSPT